ncbi:17135_t:CDS:2 [Funneliformis geosporum]|nr:17135_t:CDS:2 [Funneliformis geosporum]
MSDIGQEISCIGNFDEAYFLILADAPLLLIANQIGGLNTAEEFQGKADAEIGRIGAGVATASGESVDNAPVAPNARGSLPAVIIASGIKLGQLLYLFKTAYTIVEHLKQMAVFGQPMQGDMSVEQFSA